MKKVLIALAAACLLFGCKNAQKEEETQVEEPQVQTMDTSVKETPESKQLAEQAGEEPVFDIETTLGTIVIKLYSDTPKHRDNFVKLATSGFYDGILFHRVINGFMIQGGDPLTRYPQAADKFGTGGPGYTVQAEILPEHNHKKGALAAARLGDTANPMRESSGSQFYLVQDERNCAQLDGQYTVYGETISGLDVIDKIAAVQTDRRDRPVEDVKIISVKLHKAN